MRNRHARRREILTTAGAVAVRAPRVVDRRVESVTGEPARLTGIFHPAGSELTVAHATRSNIDAFGIQYEGKAAFSTSAFAWAA